MGQTFQWISDASCGDWLSSMNTESFGSFYSIVPRGFAAYARVLHPISRDRPIATQSWSTIDEYTYFDNVGDIDALLETQPTTWAAIATAFGRNMHSDVSFDDLLSSKDEHSTSGIAPDGWRYLEPIEGDLESDTLAQIAAVLARNTSSPDNGVAAIWEGWGGLTSSAGFARFREASWYDIFRWRPFRFRRSHPGTGVLPYEVSVGPRLEIHKGTGRSYILFEAGARSFMDEKWWEYAPWGDAILTPNSPSMLWPADHAWFLATEIDFDSTLIAGSAKLIQDLLTTEGLEVLPVDPSTYRLL